VSTLISSDPTLSPASRAPGRWIDPRGQRFGAGFSAAVLLVTILFNLVWLAALVALALAISSTFGTRWFVFGRPWPLLRRLLALRPTEPEHEYPPRFAQALGAVVLTIGVLFLLAGIRPWGWVPVLGVVGLQLLLATTGYCLGCRLYGLRWIGPALFQRFMTRGLAQR